ncbi:hypothetical protein KKG52_01425 [Patescibacteria group bacterium]|nr:hypothetical protein [Patescibacteria group bacterium]
MIALKNKERGQTLLIVVLIMVIALTVGLSVATRSIVNLRTSTEEAASQKALAAAEAGIEQALSTNTPVSGVFSANIIYNTSSAEVKGDRFLLNAGNPLLKNDGVDLWLSDYSTNESELYDNRRSGTVTIYWGEDDSCKNAALEIAVIEAGALPNWKNDAVIKKYAVDPCVARRSNNFDASVAGDTILTKPLQHSYSITVSSGIVARIIPIYFDAVIGISSTVSLPSQGFEIESTGEAGGTERKVTVFKGYPRIPSEFFPYNLFE